ncbi:MAG: NADPH-dependent F420 reductase [Anaerolineaceae bacterium]|jgi:hypothetical protein
MKVTIIGTGNMGRGIGYRMVEGGNSVTLIDQDAEKSSKLAEELRSAARNGASVTSAGLDIPELDEVVILALPYRANTEVVRQLGKRLEGRILVDIANPLNATFDGLKTESGTSSAEEVAALVPASTPVVKAFNTTFAGTLVTGKVADVPLDVLIAGDSAEAKKTVSELVKTGGLVPVDTGALIRARELESVGMLVIGLQFVQNYGFASAIKIISPN